jgi:hypothetical protein
MSPTKKPYDFSWADPQHLPMKVFAVEHPTYEL